jgi:hypothetical protein
VYPSKADDFAYSVDKEKKYTSRKHQQSTDVTEFLLSTNLNTEVSDFDEVVHQLNTISEVEEEGSDGDCDEVNVNGEEDRDGRFVNRNNREEGREDVNDHEEEGSGDVNVEEVNVNGEEVEDGEDSGFVNRNNREEGREDVNDHEEGEEGSGDVNVEEVNVNGEDGEDGSDSVDGSDGEHEDEGNEEEGGDNNDITMYVPAAGSANVYINELVERVVELWHNNLDKFGSARTLEEDNIKKDNATAIAYPHSEDMLDTLQLLRLSKINNWSEKHPDSEFFGMMGIYSAISKTKIEKHIEITAARDNLPVAHQNITHLFDTDMIDAVDHIPYDCD